MFRSKNNEPTEKVTYEEVDYIYPNEHQPFQVRDDAEMDELTESIRENGVLNPILVRAKRVEVLYRRRLHRYEFQPSGISENAGRHGLRVCVHRHRQGFLPVRSKLSGSREVYGLLFSRP